MFIVPGTYTHNMKNKNEMNGRMNDSLKKNEFIIHLPFGNNNVIGMRCTKSFMTQSSEKQNCVFAYYNSRFSMMT